MTISQISNSHRKIISTEGGYVLKALSSSDEEFVGFGELYFTSIDYNVRRGWKLHTSMTMNLFVPFGAVKFWFYDELNSTLKCTIGCTDKVEYTCLHVPPNVWFAFEGVSPKGNLLCNLSSIVHSESEVVRKPLTFKNFY